MFPLHAKVLDALVLGCLSLSARRNLNIWCKLNPIFNDNKLLLSLI